MGHLKAVVVLTFALFLLGELAVGQCVINGTVVATCEPGSDIGAQINNAISALGANGGIVSVPSGTYNSVLTTVTVNKPNISIVGNGSGATVINYTGSGDFLRIQMNPFTVEQAGRFAGFTINVSSSSVSAIHLGDTIGAQLEDLVINGPSTSGGAQIGVWFDNVSNWTERSELLRVHTNYLERDFRFTNTGSTATTDSFAYTRFLDTRANVGPGQTIISFEGGTLYNSLLSVVGNTVGGTGTTIISMVGQAYTGGPGSVWQDNIYQIQIEQTSGSGTNLFELASGTLLSGTGYIKADGSVSYGTVSGSLLSNLPYFGPNGGTATFGPQVLTSLGSLDNFYQGFGSNFLWNGTSFVTNGDTVNNGGAAILNRGTGDTDVRFFVVPTTGGANQLVSVSNLPNYQVADFGSSAITLNKNTTITGNLTVSGRVTKGSGSFQIDHPLDPANKYLYHSFVESPDMMDIYNGNVTTDKSGTARVALPTYFEALNKDFRYQLTAIGCLCQVAVTTEIRNNSFTIRSSRPHVKVSWQVTGIRHDPYANAYRIQVEETKPAAERGQYLHPELYVKEKSIAEEGVGR